MAETEPPEDVMLNICRRLPVKPLIRFTSVSKRWRFIILSDPQLAASQFKAARQRRTPGGSRLLISTGPRQLQTLDTASVSDPSSASKLSLPFEPPRVGCDVTLLGSCNGLVVVAFGDSYFYIWNPSTRFFMELPGPDFSDFQQLSYHGVGYLSATDDYRVLAASYGVYEDEESYVEKAEMKIFSSRAHVWKTIRGPGYYRSSPHQGILLNEALHWARDKIILAFDFASEKFSKMSLPNGVGFGYVGVSEGCLCVCGYPTMVYDSVDFWVMREYMVSMTHGLSSISLTIPPGDTEISCLWKAVQLAPYNGLWVSTGAW